ncbi:hypothetical protein [Duganella sp. HH101]|uniref:hypothetical protein n=1 Tax=Duganella sp. HH101 TaxID=1781066 RepID=UPI0008751A75|nr:hypothetical protein [Duganella sp. HH101]OFA01715.1 hypothetical protein DUGA2_40470 [Duganella sp. HH101]
MIPPLKAVAAAGDWSAQLRAFAELLQMEGPPPDPVLRRALADDRFASTLFMSRGQPALLRKLVASPANAAFAEAAADAVAPPVMATVGHAVAAMGRWAASGFATLSAEQADARMAVCRQCPHYTAAPKNILYGLTFDAAVDMNICSACGCVARRKSKLASEDCPKGYWPITQIKEADHA